jgi:hypothetical protein
VERVHARCSSVLATDIRPLRSVISEYTALRRDLVQYLPSYDFDRAHTGRHTAARTPSRVVCGGGKMRPR